MRTSEQINELAAALAKAQGMIKPPKKERTADAGTYTYQYADLYDIIEALREPFSVNGLSITQAVETIDGKEFLTTCLMHSSGQFREWSKQLPQSTTPQKDGSAITYFRRYNVCAAAGIVAEDDDDGAGASRPEKTAPRAAKPAKPDKPPAVTVTASQQQAKGKITEARDVQTANGQKTFHVAKITGADKVSHSYTYWSASLHKAVCELAAAEKEVIADYDIARKGDEEYRNLKFIRPAV